MTHPLGTQFQNEYDVCNGKIKLVIRWLKESKLFVAGEPYIKKGYYWHFSVMAPDGTNLVGQSHGPFDTMPQAKMDSKRVIEEAKANV